MKIWALYVCTKWGDDGIEIYETEIEALSSLSWMWENEDDDVQEKLEKALKDKDTEEFYEIFNDISGNSSHNYCLREVEIPVDLLAANLENKFGKKSPAS